MSEIMDQRSDRPPAAVSWREYVIRPIPWRSGVASLSGAGGRLARPLAYTGNHARAMNILVLVVDGLPRSGILDRTGDGLRAVFKSRFFGFPDEAVFWQDRQARRIHVWSAARHGLWDWGVNRRRVELMRERFHLTLVGGA